LSVSHHQASAFSSLVKLAQIRIWSFRCYRDEFAVTFDALACIIAKNDAGKLTILEALDAFFNLEKLGLRPAKSTNVDR
jgi:predicted ATP-dependent endonuclease of OLD family